MTVNYLEPSQVLAAKIVLSPEGWRPSATGYGRKIPTRYMIQLVEDKRWRRVYVVCYSNAGTAYVQTKGQPFLVISRAENRIRELAGV